MSAAELQGSGIAGRTTTSGGSLWDFTSLGLQIALFASSVASAFMVGMATGFGMQLMRLVDKLSLLSDLAFYAAIIGASFAPLAVVMKFASDEAVRNAAHARSEHDRQKQKEAEAHNAKAQSDYEEMRRSAGRLKRLTIKKPKPVVYTPSLAEPQEHGASYVTVLPVIVLLLIASYVFLGFVYSLIFWCLVLPLMSLLWWRGRWSTRLSGAVVSALFFGLLHAEALRASPPDTLLDLGSSADQQRATVVMTTAGGIVALNSERQLVLWPWGRISGVTVTSSGSDLMQSLRRTIASKTPPENTN